MSDNEKIKLYQYNAYQINIQSEASAGIAIAIRNNIKHQLIDDFNGDMLAIRIETSKGPVLISNNIPTPTQKLYTNSRYEENISKTNGSLPQWRP